MTLTGAAAGNYTLTQPTGVTGVINPKALTVSGTVVANKVYDGGTSATITSSGALNGIVGSDAVLIDSSGTAQFASANANPAQAVTISGITLTGLQQANYTVVQPTGITAAITPKALTVGSTQVASKVYDGTTTATITSAGSLSGIVNSDDVSITGGAAQFVSANVNAGQGVTISGMSLAGTAADNYTLTQPTSVTAAITAKALTVTGTTVANKVYDTTTTASITAAGSLLGVIAGDIVTVGAGSASANFASADVAYSGNSVTTQAVSISGLALGGAAAGNYSITQPTDVIASITPKALTVSGMVANTSKVYDGTTSVVTSAGSLIGGASSANDGKYYSTDTIALSGSVTASYNSADVVSANTINFSVASFGLTGAANVVGNYVLSPVSSVAGSITPKELTMSGLSVAASKVYDGTTAASTTGNAVLGSGLITGDSVSIIGTPIATYNSPNVASANAVSYSGLSLTGASASNYTLTMQAPSTATITPAELTVIGLSVGSKSYDRTDVATANVSALSLLGVVAADAGVSAKLDLNATYVSAVFASANVAYSNGAVASQAVTISGLVLSGTSAANYALVQPSATGTINPLAITVTSSAANKAYDGTSTATATVATANTVALADISASALSLSHALASFSSANVGDSQLVTVSGISASGSAASNYVFNSSATSTANITKATLIITAANDSKVYGDTSTAGGVSYTPVNGSSPATASANASVGYSVSGLIGNDSIDEVVLTSIGGLAGSGVANTYAITPSAATGSGFANYNISYVGGTMTVSQAVLEITATGNNKVYDATATGTASLSIAGIKNGDNVTASPSSISFASANVGSAITLTVNGISIDNANYIANTSAVTAANITPAPLVISAAGVDRVYNGNAVATATLSLGGLSGVKGSDASALVLGYGSASFADANVEFNGSTVITKTVSVSGITLSGAVAANYSFNSTASTTAKINPATLTVTAAAANKAYDGSTSASVTLANNSIAGDAVAVDYTSASFANPNVGTAKVVTVAGLSLSGASAANYTLAGVSSLAPTADITALGLIISAVNDTKIYGNTVTVSGLTYVANGASTTSSVTTSSNARFTVSGLLGSDTVSGVTLSSTGGLSSASVNGGPYTIIPSAATGSGVANYVITYVNGEMLVTPKTVTISAVAADKTYNGNTTAIATLTPSGILSADAANVSVIHTAANFASKDVVYATAPTVATQDVNISGVALSGTAASNYTLAGVNSLTATNAKITPAVLTITATAANKVYDATSVAVVSLTGNVISGDAINFDYTGASFTDANAGVGKLVTVSGLSLSGAQSGNYILNSVANAGAVATTNATITPAPLSFSATGDNKVYDGTNTATVTLAVTGLKGSDTASGTYSSATFADHNVGNAIGITVTGLGYNSSSGANYTVSSSVSAFANITPKTLVVTASNASMVYGDAYPTFAYTTSGWVNSTEQANAATLLTGVRVTASAINAGVHTANVVASSGVARNYSVIYTPGDLTIGQFTLTAQLQNAAKVIGDVNPDYTFAYTGFRNGDTLATAGLTAPTVLVTGSPSTAGNYPITASGGGSANYAISTTYTGASNSILTVVPAQQLLVTLSGIDTTVYGTASVAPTVVSAKYSVQNANLSYSVYSLALTQSGNNWVGVDTANGGQVTNFVTSSNRSQFSNVGNYITTLSGSAANNYLVTTSTSGGAPTIPNYTSVAVANGLLTVTPAALTIAAANDSKIYGATTTANGVSFSGINGVSSTPASYVASGLLVNDQISSVRLTSSGAVVAANVSNGPYVLDINNAQGVGLGNYVITYVSGNLTVNPATLTITASNDAKVYGATTTTRNSLAYGNGSIVTGSGYVATGLVNGDAIYGLTLNSSGALAASGVAAGNSSNGAYVITPSAAVGSPGLNTNYNLVYVDGLMTVTPATLTISATNDTKVYGSNTTALNQIYSGGSTSSASGFNVQGLVNGDAISAVTLSSLGATTTASVGGGAVSGAYAIVPSAASGSAGLDSNYLIQYIAGEMVVTPATLLVTATASNKVYDGNANAIVTLSGNTVGSDVVTIGNTGAVFADKNAASGKTVTVSGLSLSGSNAVNYTLGGVGSVTSTADITPATLVVTATGNNKVYDATTAATVNLAGNSLGNDVVNISTTGATFADKNVGNAKAVSIAGIAISGADAANYTLAGVSSLSTNANITPATLTVSASGSNKVYDGNTAATVTLSLAGVIAGDIQDVIPVSYLANFVDKNVANSKAISVSSITLTGAAATNYFFNSAASTTADITPATLLVTATGNNKVYDATTVSTVNLVGNAIGNDVVTISTTGATFADKNVGTTKPVVITGISISGADASNYTLAGVSSLSTTADVTPATLTVSAVGSNKVYDGNTAATVSLSGNAFAGDVVDLTYTGATFANKNAGLGKTITVAGVAISGADAANYSVVSSATTTADITPKTIAANFSIVDKVYDGTSAVSFTANAVVGLIAGDTLSYVAGNATFADINVGSNKPVVISAITLSGVDAANYVLSNTQANFVANITPAPLTITAATKSIVYGAQTLPALTYTASGLVGNDAITGTLAAPTNLSLYNGNDGSASPVSGGGVSYPIGLGTITAGANYQITYVAANVNVTPKAITISTAPISALTYGTAYNLSAVAATATGLINGDYITAVTAEFVNGGSNLGTIPSTMAAGSYTNSIIVVPGTATGRGLANYNPTYARGNLSINPAPLTVTVVGDAKLVTTSDAVGYGGVIASGFKNGETLASLGGTLTITRSNATVQAVGSYAGALNASGFTSSNYAITYVPGNYDILPVETLLVKLGNVSATYGNGLSYSPVASYMTANNTLVASSNSASGLVVTTSGNQVQVTDGAGGQYNFNANPVGGQLSSSGVLNAGAYLLTAGSPLITGSSFTSAFVVGAATVLPKALTVGADFTIAPVSKVYDGSTSISSAASAVVRTVGSNIRASDAVQIASSGSYANKNVGTGLTYSIDINLTGTDAGNYYITGGSSATGNNGVITQLTTPVTWVGPTAGAYWSNPSNWAGGAIPDFANVKYTAIPIGVSVIYDAGLTSPVETIVNNSGNITFANLPSGTQSVVMNISGNGSLTVSNGAAITLAGTTSSYTGNTILSSGSRVIAATNNAIGAGNIQSNAGYFGTASGVTLPALRATGPIRLTSDITTVGPQTYEDIVLAKSTAANTLALATTNSDIRISGTINDSVAKTSSMVINAGTGDVTLGDSIGNIARFKSLTVTGENIYILADILTGTTQTYNGNIKIGSGTYIGKQFVEGFLFATHNRYFRYGTGTAASSYDYKNNDPRYVRTLISEDPMITFNGLVDDISEYTHTLLVAAIAPSVTSIIGRPSTPIINFYQEVSSITPLYGLNAQAIVSDTSVTCSACEINLVGGVKTYGSQTYRAGIMNASATTLGGEVTFSIYDPNASVNYILPLQTNGQINLRNPGSSDGLLINGKNNFSSAANLTGDENWGSRFKEGVALGSSTAVTTSSVNHFDLRKLKAQAELSKEEYLVVGEITIDELEEDSVDCSRPEPDKPLNPKCKIEI